MDQTTRQLDNTITYPTNSIGCDSTATLDLTIIQTPQTSAGPDVNSCSLEATLKCKYSNWNWNLV